MTDTNHEDTMTDTTEMEDTMTTTETDTTDTADTTDEQTPNPNAEAAKYRHRAKEAEAERDTLAAQVQSLQRVALDGLCAAAGIKTEAVLTVTELSDLTAENGTLDTEKVTEAVTAAQDKLGIRPITKGVYVPTAGTRPTTPPRGHMFADAFKPNRG